MEKEKVIKITFQNGDMKVYKNVIEYVSGLYYFFMVQLKDSIETSVSVNRNEIFDVETRYKNSWRQVNLKKRN